MFSKFFFSKTNGYTQNQNNIVEVKFQIRMNKELSNLAKLLHIAEFIYNNANNKSILYISFKLH